MEELIQWLVANVLPADFFARIFEAGWETPWTFEVLFKLAVGYVGMYVVFLWKHKERGGKTITLKEYMRCHPNRTRLSLIGYPLLFLIGMKGLYMTIAHAIVLDGIWDFLVNKYEADDA